MKKIPFVMLAMIAFSSVFTGCLSRSNNQAPEIQMPASNAPSASWRVVYNDFDSFAKASDLILAGRVTGETIDLRHNLVFTLQEVEVLTVYKGGVQEGESVTVSIDGGIMDDVETIPFDEIPLMEIGKEYLLFLEGNDTAKYVIPLSYQGIYLIENGTLRVPGVRHDDIAKELEGMGISEIERMLAEM